MFHRVLALASLAFVLMIAVSPSRAQTWAEMYATGQVVAPGHRALPRTAPMPIARSSVEHLIRRSAERHGVPVRLALAVAKVESNFRCNAIGRAGERSVLQIKPATARGLGYRGSAAGLTNCGAGLDFGMRHLAAAWRRCGSKAGAMRLHNRGLGSSCHGGGAYVVRAMAALGRV
jgi:soluble lytic murein transglycosylase-like protein